MKSLNKKYGWFTVVILIASLAAYFVLATTPASYKIAYIGRYENPAFEKLNTDIIKSYLKRIEKRHTNFKLDLVIYSNEADPEVSKKLYKNISKDKKFIAVFDNTWGKDIQPTANIIRNSDIPVISLNADKNEVDFADRAIFLGHDDDVPDDISHFLKGINGKPQVLFLGEHDYASSKEFEISFAKYGIDIKQRVYLEKHGESSADDIEATFSELWNKLDTLVSNRTKQSPVYIVAGIHGSWGAELIKRIEHTKFEDVTIISGPYLIGSRSESLIENIQKNTVILITRPVDSVSKGIQLDFQELKKTNPDNNYSNWNVPLFLSRANRACSIISEGINRIKQDATLVSNENINNKPDLTITRQKILDYFKSLKQNTITAFDGDSLYLNENLMARREAAFEQIKHGKPHSYPKQFGSNRKLISNVFVGLEFLGISNLNLDEGTFYSDFILSIASEENVDLKDIMHFSNSKGETNISQLVGPDQDKKPNSGNYFKKVYKVSGEFRMTPSLKSFPLDQQELVISMGSIKSSSDYRLSFMKKEKQHDNLENSFSVAGWTVDKTYTTIDEHLSKPLDYIGEKYINPNRYDYRSVSIWINLKRSSLVTFLTALLPPLVIGLSALLILAIKDLSFENIGDACIAIFLSIITYSVAYQQLVPKSTEFTKSDIVFYATFLLVMLVMLYVIVLNTHKLERFFSSIIAKASVVFLGIIYFMLSGYAIWLY